MNNFEVNNNNNNNNNNNVDETSLLSVRDLYKSYVMGKGFLEVLKGIDLDIKMGEALCIVGSSGAGKSTLLHILGTLDRPTKGSVYYKGKNLFLESDTQLASFRNNQIGFVFQFHHLLSEFTAIENVMMPCKIRGISHQVAKGRAYAFLQKLGLTQRAGHYPNELSGGELQRVAIARALVGSPQILLADEPTGNLDTVNGKIIQDLFFQLKKELGLTLIIVTHDKEFASRFPKTLTIVDGKWV